MPAFGRWLDGDVMSYFEKHVARHGYGADQFDPACRDALGRYIRRHRRPAMKLASHHPRLTDLALSFPALLFRLALGKRGQVGDPEWEQSRERAIAMVISGAKLKAVAAEAGVPMWMRHVPHVGLREPFGDMPDGFLVRRHFGQHIPDPELWPSAWVASIDWAHAVCDETFACWVARHYPMPTKQNRLSWDRSDLTALALYAWYSANDPVHLFGQKRWHPRLGVYAACDGADAWLGTAITQVWMAGKVPKLWHRPSQTGRYAIVPVNTALDLNAEAEAMRHCVRDFADDIMGCRSQIWSVRDGAIDGPRVATVEIGRESEQEGPLVVSQVYGPENRHVEQGVLDAVYRWFLDGREHAFHASRFAKAYPCMEAWKAFASSYWRAKSTAGGDCDVLPRRMKIEVLGGYRGRIWNTRYRYGEAQPDG